MNNYLYANGVRRCVEDSDIFIVNSVQETSNIIKGVRQNFKILDEMNYLCTDGVGWYVKNSNIIIVHSVKELSNSTKGACQNLESKWKNWAKLSAIAILNCLFHFLFCGKM